MRSKTYAQLLKELINIKTEVEKQTNILKNIKKSLENLEETFREIKEKIWVI